MMATPPSTLSYIQAIYPSPLPIALPCLVTATWPLYTFHLVGTTSQALRRLRQLKNTIPPPSSCMGVSSSAGDWVLILVLNVIGVGDCWFIIVYYSLYHFELLFYCMWTIFIGFYYVFMCYLSSCKCSPQHRPKSPREREGWDEGQPDTGTQVILGIFRSFVGLYVLYRYGLYCVSAIIRWY